MQKGYWVFDRPTQKVVYSRNVKFDGQQLERPPAEEEESARGPLVLGPIMPSSVDNKGTYERENDTNEDTLVVAEIFPRRSTEERRPVDYDGFSQAHLTTYCKAASFEEASNCLEKAK